MFAIAAASGTVDPVDTPALGDRGAGCGLDLVGVQVAVEQRDGLVAKRKFHPTRAAMAGERANSALPGVRLFTETVE